ncbi:hypothetical protein MHY87_03770 [Microvirga sp. ACRRW]|uniref:hypothetical protein n=1 Tax=Microvirga sp. ACRRW TaxID=2918205 RepID=UPI001EF45CBC|nr:hypothetical protein [Microvirga sp. ACRRW]MCG7392018.1 hypothetical protein [Microvirga sp. ACRRW]
MIRNVIAGFWVCAVTLGSCYAAVTWMVGRAATEEKPHYEGLQYKKLPPLNIPIIAEGAVQGYVVGNFVFTADSRTLREISVPPEAFIQDEIFRHVYSDDTLDFRKLSRYNVNGMIASVKEKINKRLGADIVKEILIENFNFISKSDIRS